MKLAVSNLAWGREQDIAVGAVLLENGFAGIELAPTKYWSDLTKVSGSEIDEVKRSWIERGLSVCALQSLLFGRASASLFGEAAARAEFVEVIGAAIRIAGRLGAKALVFGSPKNRLKGERSTAEAIAECAPVFRELGSLAQRHETKLCVEPNPVAYGCDFITTSDEGALLVEAVGSPGFGLHLDAAGMQLSGEDLAGSIRRHAALISHFHLSAPQLGAVGPGAGIDYSAALEALSSIGFSGWASIEMRPVSESDGTRNVAAVEAAVEFVAGLIED